MNYYHIQRCKNGGWTVNNDLAAFSDTDKLLEWLTKELHPVGTLQVGDKVRMPDGAVGTVVADLSKPWLPDDRGGWIEHDGGPCPVPSEVWVEVLKERERQRRSYEFYAQPASSWCWDDNVAYRVVER
jgi:hypothetical protein